MATLAEQLRKFLVSEEGKKYIEEEKRKARIEEEQKTDTIQQNPMPGKLLMEILTSESVSSKKQ